MTANDIIPSSAVTPLAIMQRPLPPDRHPAHVYIARLGSGSRRTMSEALNTIAAIVTTGRADLETMPWAALRYQHTAAVRSALMEKYKPSTANKILAALRGVLKESWRLGYMTAEDYHRAADVPTIKAQTLPRGRALASGEISALMAACGREVSPAGIRDAALIAVLYGAGLRRSESVGLDLSDYNVETGELVIRGAKGRKDRLGYATDGSADALKDWLVVRGYDPGPLFCNINKSGRITIHRMTDQAVLHILRKRGAEAGVASFSPHDLRRSFISDLLDAGTDISTAQQLAGHANVTTTARYDRRGEATKRKAAELLHVPYLRKRAKV
jgi:site-specific recombinase XerD